MPQATAALLMEQYESAMTYLEAIKLHIAHVWDMFEQLQVINLRTRYERLTGELRLAALREITSPSAVKGLWNVKTTAS